MFQTEQTANDLQKAREVYLSLLGTVGVARGCTYRVCVEKNDTHPDLSSQVIISLLKKKHQVLVYPVIFPV